MVPWTVREKVHQPPPAADLATLPHQQAEQQQQAAEAMLQIK
jgi:hypothetical protein